MQQADDVTSESAAGRGVLQAMVERLLASMTGGPALNCRPHSSRQRLDLTALADLGGEEASPGRVIAALLGPAGKVTVTATVPPPPPDVARRATIAAAGSRRGRPRPPVGDAQPSPEAPPAEPLTDDERAAVKAWDRQSRTLAKLRAIAEDARVYEQDTGVAALSLGLPLLSVPPAGALGGGRGVGRRVLAPVAFVPLNLAVRTGPRPRVELSCRGEGTGRVVPNGTLLLWLAQQNGTDAGETELFDDPEGEDPWRELRELVAHVAGLTGIDKPADPDALFADLTAAPTAAESDADPRPRLLGGAVLGLFPAASQGLLRDARAMADGEELAGPVRSFVDVGTRLGDDAIPAPAGRDFAGERAVATADPCQMRAVRLARAGRGLVIHGPPGTGKSQTITNVVADGLSRGERVLFVCDKRTALDVVYNRLEGLGLGGLCALIHDAQRDRAELYRKVRDNLDALAETRTDPAAARRLAEVDRLLAARHAELTGYHAALHKSDESADPPMSLHDLIGRWLSAEDGGPSPFDAAALADVSPPTFADLAPLVRDALERGAAAGWDGNPWRGACLMSLAELLAVPAAAIRKSADDLAQAATAADETRDPAIPPFDAAMPLDEQVMRRRTLADSLESVGDLDPAWAAIVSGDWSKIGDATTRLAQVDAHAALLRQSPVDAALEERAGDITADEAQRRREALRAFLKSLQTWAGRVAPAGASGESRAVALRWLKAGEEARRRAARQLNASAALAETVRTDEPDAALLRGYRRAGHDAASLAARRAAVAEYESSAGGLLGFLAFGKKKAAAPLLASLGLPTNAAGAGQAKALLNAVQARVDLSETVAEATGEPAGDALDATALLTQFDVHRDTLRRLDAEPAAAAPVESALLADIAAALPESAAARPAVEALGLTLKPADTQRAAAFYKSLLARLGLRSARAKLLPDAPSPADDAALVADHAAASATLAAQAKLAGGADAATLQKSVAGAVSANGVSQLIAALRASAARAKAIAVVDAAASVAPFSAEWRAKVNRSLLAGGAAAGTAEALQSRVDSLENVVRVRETLATLPPALSSATAALLKEETKPADALRRLGREVDAGEIRRRLAAAPDLGRADAKRLVDALAEYRSLQYEKLGLVRDAILDRWTTRQRDRLLSATGTRLNGVGADLRRRLAIRGKKVMRLRQVVRAGRDAEGGDPLFDLCPVWMASPETVASVFPREAVFDVVIFDEASQVRLEEALPVMTRAGRVVIAGDPKQLPPTRFFETTLATSEETEAETDQELFESQQADTEDLLGAALGLDVQQCFLDVHYRSRNSDLIGFSNDHFYGSRLQAIPVHPANRTVYAPLRLYRVDGVYAERTNVVEAEQVVTIVRDLLKWAEPPSIGIACFNLPQKDLIVEKLDAAALEDSAFAAKLAAARERRGGGGFEGLFVKNLENVQGDERDHLIISTTYGPSPEGKFRRNFGPVSQGGGGRRLNVLVTRARHEVHLVTSIPAGEYAALPPVPEGQQPTGRWLLYAYLHYAESLGRLYDAAAEREREAERADAPPLTVGPTRTPSRLAEALAARLQGESPVRLYWGNDGFGIDLTLGGPGEPSPATTAAEAGVRPLPLGVLCDLTRFDGTDDPVEWEAFRTLVHESQGWNLRRLFSPALFRDPTAANAR